MKNVYSYEVSKILKEAEKIKKELKHAYVGTEHLFLSLLKMDEYTKSIFLSYDITYNSFKEELLEIIKPSENINRTLYTPLLKRIINNINKDKSKLTARDLLVSLLELKEGIAIRLLMELGVDVDKIYLSEQKIDSTYSKKLEVFNIGKNMQELEFDPVVNRDEEINLIIETLLRKNKNNPLLIGEPGVGKSAIIEELSRRIKEHEVPLKLANKKIVSIEMGSLISGTKYRGEFEEKLENIIKEVAENQDIILFIDEIHTIVNAGGAEGAINASDILKPYLARGTIKLIGATTLNEYNKYILKDKALTRRFEVIKICEPDLENTKDILWKIKENYEKHYNITIDRDVINTIVTFSDKYILNRFNPDKSIDLLDSACAMKVVKNNKDKKIQSLTKELKETTRLKEEMVRLNNFESALTYRELEKSINEKIANVKEEKLALTSNDIKTVLNRKLNIPSISSNFDTLASSLSEVIIGQQEAIKEIVKCIKNKEENIPLSIMLTGNTGVGKTKTVKELANILNIPLIRLDMTEYSTELGITRLIGANQGYVGYSDRTVFDELKLKPYSVILLDEIEKAHPSVINLFLQILDEGFITDAKGEKIDFKNTYIFMTSNATLQKQIGFMKTSGTYDDYFSKEFLGRITKTIRYKDVDENMFQEYLKKKNIKSNIKLDTYDYKRLGFRSLDKIIKEYSY